MKQHGIAWLNYLPGYQGETWNPVIGCTWASPGCDHCYARNLHDMRHDAYTEGKRVPACYSAPFSTVRYLPERLEHPLHWRAPRMIFVNSMGDLFHNDVPVDAITNVFATMALVPHHQFVILTKRAQRMAGWFAPIGGTTRRDWVWSAMARITKRADQRGPETWPPPNVWLGVTAENQAQADARIPLLLDTPAAKRFVSIEPMLGPVDLRTIIALDGDGPGRNSLYWIGQDTGIDWVIVGGESGPQARPMHPDWARGVRDQCVEARVPFFFKQWGAVRDWKSARLPGDQLDGAQWHQMPSEP